MDEKILNEHEKLQLQLTRHVEQPEPTFLGPSYKVGLDSLATEWNYIEFIFSDDGKLILVNLIPEEVLGITVVK